MIISKSESESSAARSDDSYVGSDAPPSPPPYSPTATSGYGNSAGFPTPSGSMPNPNAPPAPRANLPPRCNYLVDRKLNSSVSGTWHVDTALVIPERLLPPFSEFDGFWNQDAQKARKEYARRTGWLQSWRAKPDVPPPPPPVEVRPNLMVGTTNGAISGQVHVHSSDGVFRQAIIVAQGFNGSVSLKIRAPPEQPLRVFATSTNGSVTVRIPSSFEGAVMMSTTWGDIKISDTIKTKLTTFSSTSNTSRCFIGDWQASGFGFEANRPNPDANSNSNSDSNTYPPVPTTPPAPVDPFASWKGPLVHIASTHGAVSLSFVDEGDFASGFSKAILNFMGGLFGSGEGNQGHGNDGPSSRPLPPPPGPESSQPGKDAWPGDVKRPVSSGTEDPKSY